MPVLKRFESGELANICARGKGFVTRPIYDDCLDIITVLITASLPA